MSRSIFIFGSTSLRACARRSGRSIALQSYAATRRFSATTSDIPADFGFAFDIDGVLLRHRSPIAGATEALKYLNQNNIPFILLTNGGGKHESDRVAELSRLLEVPVDEEMFVQSHTPFKGLVPRFGDGNVLVIGGEETGEKEGVLHGGTSRKGKSGGGLGVKSVAQRYGFKHVYTPNMLLHHHPMIWPFSIPKLHLHADSFSSSLSDPLVRLPPERFDAVLVFNDPRHWGPTLQLVLDLMLSEKGKLGTYSPLNGTAQGSEGRKWQNDEQPELIWSNPDLWWQASYHLPRLGQGGFRAALQGVWRAVTGGEELRDTLYGKPHKATYEYASKVLDKLLHKKHGGEGCLKTVYMVGDNPRSDIAGANSHGWHSVLVQTGVFRHDRDGGLDSLDVDHKPKTVVEDVKQAVEFAVEQAKKQKS